MSSIQHRETNEIFELVELKENYILELHANYRKGQRPNEATFPESVKNTAFDLTIKRNFLDDTFSMYWPVYKPSSTPPHSDEWKKIDWSASTSNKVTVDKSNGLLSSVRENGRNVTSAKSFALDNIKFRDATSWTKYWNGTHSSTILSVFPHFDTFPQQIMIKENQCLDIALVRAFEFFTDDITLLGDGEYQIIPRTRKYLTHFYIFPRKFDQFNHQVSVADIYTSNEVSNTSPDGIFFNNYAHTYDFSNSARYQSSAITGDMNITLKDKFDAKPNILKKVGDDSYIKNTFYVGTFDLIDQTYYDFDNNKSVIGLSSTSKVGEIIPYGFKGSLTRKFNLGFIDFLKNFKVGITSEVKQKVLDPYAGQIMLNLKESNSFGSLNEQNELNGDQLEMLRILLSDVKFIPLIGIKRFSDE